MAVMVPPATRLIAALAAVITTVAMTACTRTTPDAGQPTVGQQQTGHNTDDVAFVTGMIPHHQQAVELAALVPDRSSTPEVTTLAARISAAQRPEIDTMKGLLAQWTPGTPVPDVGHGDHGAMQGMVDDPTLSRLKTLRDKAFDTLWLQSMISHHEGAVEMATAEIARGGNVDAIALAKTIVDAQQAEIAQMRQMLRQG